MPQPVRLGDATLNARGPRAGDGVAAQFQPSTRIPSSVSEASDVVALPGGRLAVVSDTETSLRIVDANGRDRTIALPGMHGTSGFEAVTYDPERNHLFVAREEKGEVLRYEWDPASSEPPVLEKKIKLGLDGPKNKGVEGLAYLPEAFSPTGEPQLLVAKEGRPKQLLLLGDGGGGEPVEIELEQQLKDVLDDFSAVAVDPKSGHVFISSDESSMVAQVRLVRDGDTVRARLIQAVPLRDARDRPLGRVEGLTFNARGDLFVLTENDGALHQLRRR